MLVQTALPVRMQEILRMCAFLVVAGVARLPAAQMCGAHLVSKLLNKRSCATSERNDSELSVEWKPSKNIWQGQGQMEWKQSNRSDRLPERDADYASPLTQCRLKRIQPVP